MTAVTKGQTMGRVSYEIDGYSHGTNPIPAVARIGNTVMTGGISGLDLASGKLPATIEEQCDNLFEVAAKILEPAGATLGDVLKVTVFLRPDIDRAPLNKVWLKHFPDEHSRPVRHVIVNPNLAAGMLIQCEIVAILGTDRQPTHRAGAKV
jgi:2-iminobutanoate/2-iminopropanoate deaminase